MSRLQQVSASKVPEVTLGFWVIKILATTLGETGGDAVTMTLNLGYLIGTAIFATILVVAVSAQIRARRFHPFLYWAVIVATTTAGTTLADFCDRSLGIGYTGGASILFALTHAISETARGADPCTEDGEVDYVGSERGVLGALRRATPRGAILCM